MSKIFNIGFATEQARSADGVAVGLPAHSAVVGFSYSMPKDAIFVHVQGDPDEEEVKMRLFLRTVGEELPWSWEAFMGQVALLADAEHPWFMFGVLEGDDSDAG